MTADAIAGRVGENPRRALLSVLVLLAAGFVLWRLPGTAGTSWTEVGSTLRTVSPFDLLLLTVVWAAGLWCHSWVLTASLPGLTTGQALLLNLGGSAVCDVLPFGAAAGTAMSLLMVRSWRFSPARFATFAAVSNLWNVLAKLGLPAAVLIAVLASGSLSSPRLLATTGAAVVVLVVLVAVVGVAIGSDRAATTLGRIADHLCGWILRRSGSSRRTRFEVSVPAMRAATSDVIRQGWPQLTAGMCGYLALQALLWWMCLQLFSAHLSPMIVLATFAVERVLSMLPITPGGAGLAEAGSIATLVSFGADPLAVTAAVLLFRAFAFLIEIPVGGAGILAWMWLQRRQAAR